MRARVLTILSLICLSACSKQSAEAALRARLGVPADAKTVVIFSQTAHLDIDWQKTFDDYYASYVDQIFTEAGQILATQPRAAYSVAEMAYLENYVELHPEQLAPLKAAAQRGALRIVGGGMTSPDTLLPETELLVRDYLYGAQFSEDMLGARPHAAWLPDSFGHSGTAPDLLAAAGFDSVAFARVDGQPTLFELIEDPHAAAKPGSTEALLEQLGSADFLWKGPGGGQVFAHLLMHNLYCTGDDLDYDEPLQVPGGHIGPYRGDDPDFTDGKIATYVAALQPFAKTPYLFVTVGCDFQHPKPQLLSYLDGYNQRNHASTGVWTVAATFEEYAQLAQFHKDALPVLDTMEPTPYFMGFYATRAGVKQAARAALRPMLAAEAFSTALGAAGSAILAPMRAQLKLLTRADHHDFITGTSTDDVAAREQLPLLAAAQDAGTAAAAQVAAQLNEHIVPVPGSLGRVLALNPSSATETVVLQTAATFAIPAGGIRAVVGSASLPVEVLPAAPGALRLEIVGMPPFSWQAVDFLAGGSTAPASVTVQLLDPSGAPATGAAIAKVILANEHLRAEWNNAGGFALTSLQLDGNEVLAGPSFLVSDALDDGGLWRMGNEEESPCALTPLAPVAQVDTVNIADQSGLSITLQFQTPAYTAPDGTAIPAAVREARLDAGANFLDLALITGAANATTRTAIFALAATSGAPLRTSSAAGFLERTPQRVYTPTYWPAAAWASIGTTALLLRQSTGVRFAAAGTLEAMAVRNAPKEKCDFEGGTGTDDDVHRIEWRLQSAATPAAAEQESQAFNRPVQLASVSTGGTTMPAFPASAALLTVSGDGVISALKPADRGDGLILRGLLLPGPLSVTISPWLPALHATRTDSSERDLSDLGAVNQAVTLDRAQLGALATVRLLP